MPDFASVKYTFRAMDINTMMDVEKRLHDIAAGAALMTGTRVEIERLGGCYPVLNNHVVADVVDRSMREIKMEEWSREDIEYARKLNETIYDQWKECVEFREANRIRSSMWGLCPLMRRMITALQISETYPICARPASTRAPVSRWALPTTAGR